MSGVDTTNDFFVGVQGNRVVIMRPVPNLLTKEQALRLAAWLVALADDDCEFPAVLKAVQNT